jgi:hypothetical protein
MPEVGFLAGLQAVRLAEQIVASYAAGEPYMEAVARLCARCEAAGIDHSELLDEVMRRESRRPAVAPVRSGM